MQILWGGEGGGGGGGAVWGGGKNRRSNKKTRGKTGVTEETSKKRGRPYGDKDLPTTKRTQAEGIWERPTQQ